MIHIQQLIKAYETIQKAKIEQELLNEQKQLQKALNEHYTSYNRCYYLKYSPEEKELFKELFKYVYLMNTDKEKRKKYDKLQTKLDKNKIYWKLENRI